MLIKIDYKLIQINFSVEKIAFLTYFNLYNHPYFTIEEILIQNEVSLLKLTVDKLRME